MQAQLVVPVSNAYLQAAAYSQHDADAFCIAANSACLARQEKSSAGIFSERRYGLNDLGTQQLVSTLTTSSGNFGMKASYYGGVNYNEITLGLAYGRRLGNKISVGSQFKYAGIHEAGYGNASTIGFGLGIILHAAKWNAGIHIENSVSSLRGNSYSIKLPAIYKFGIGYDVSATLFLGIEIIKEEDQPVNVNTSVQYKLIPQLFAKGGVCSATGSVWMGAGYWYRHMRIDLSTSYHPQLGISPGLALLFMFKEKKIKDVQ